MRKPSRGSRSALLPPAALLLAVLLLAGVPVAGPAGAQEPGQAPPAEGTGSDRPDIDAILESDEEVLFGGGGYTYDPGGRRDPFKSLLDARERPDLRGPRPEGVPGLLIDEITITGIFRTPRGRVAQVQASDKDKSYLVREGDELYDGDVVAIGPNEVVFKQIVQDPTALKPFREVVKRLSP